VAGPKESTSVVTIAQRARLVIALGVLNLVLASFALAVGIAGPLPPDQDVAGIDRTPIVSGLAETPSATTSGAVLTEPLGPGSSAGSGSSTASPIVEPSPSASAGSEPSPSDVIVAVGPTPIPSTTPSAAPGGPGDQPSANPTPPVEPQPTKVPATPGPTAATPRPTPAPTAAPIAKPIRVMPPCPDGVNKPPGHHKAAVTDRPCKPAAKHGKHSKGNVTSGGFIFIVPPLAGGLLGIGRGPLRPLRRRLGTR
jgi:hypothetical protein